MNRVEIARIRAPEREEFAATYLHGTGSPVIITDAMERWAARKKWTFAYLRERFGDDLATAPLGLGSAAARVTSVAAFIDFLDNPGAELPGLWVDARSGAPLSEAPGPTPSPPYLLGWYAFQRHPELFDDIRPSPGFLDDWVEALSPTLREVFEFTAGAEYWSLYLGPAGTLSPLHQDYWHTHSCLSQLQGRKRAILFSPEDSTRVYGGAIDAEQPDETRFPLLAEATAFVGEIGPGDMLFMPAGWWHCVRAVEPSMTVSHNFFNASNVNAHLGGVLRRLPRLVDGLANSDEWRRSLDVRWTRTDLAP
jgi:hypothetical protein